MIYVSSARCNISGVYHKMIFNVTYTMFKLESLSMLLTVRKERLLTTSKSRSVIRRVAS